MDRLVIGQLDKQHQLTILGDVEVFDKEISEQLKTKGMQLAVDHLTVWKEAARSWVMALQPGEEFDADDLVLRIGLPTDQDGRPTNNGIGGFICGLARKGVIEHVGWQKSTRVTNHAHLNRIWRRR